jgi:uncharacterized protein with HEPN domain
MVDDSGSIQVRLLDILDEIRNLTGETAGLRFEIFNEVWVLRRAAERSLEIISEASRHIPDRLKQEEPDIPWRQIAGIGNVLRHDYESISTKVVWDIITNHLGPLEAAVRRLLKMVGPDEAQW